MPVFLPVTENVKGLPVTTSIVSPIALMWVSSPVPNSILASSFILISSGVNAFINTVSNNVSILKEIYFVGSDDVISILPSSFVNDPAPITNLDLSSFSSMDLCPSTISASNLLA